MPKLDSASASPRSSWSVASISTSSLIVSTGAPLSRSASLRSPPCAARRLRLERARQRVGVVLEDDHARERVERVDPDDRALHHLRRALREAHEPASCNVSSTVSVNPMRRGVCTGVRGTDALLRHLQLDRALEPVRAGSPAVDPVAERVRLLVALARLETQLAHEPRLGLAFQRCELEPVTGDRCDPHAACAARRNEDEDRIGARVADPEHQRDGVADPMRPRVEVERPGHVDVAHGPTGGGGGGAAGGSGTATSRE